MDDRPGPARLVLPSLTRISDLKAAPFDVAPLERARWANGQYVAVEVTGDGARAYDLELPDGRVAEVLAGDRVVGALGRRAATLQAVGDWESVVDPERMDMLSIAGVIGRCTSRSPFGNPVAPVRYLGHVLRSGRPVCMGDFVADRVPRPLAFPAILIVGTSMDAGKTTVGARIVRGQRERGRRVAAAKLTGVGRYRDVLAMGDAGAEWVLDFVDAGLPSTVVPRTEFDAAVGGLLGAIADLPADVALLEAGASPLEPYNGDAAVALLGQSVRAVVLCASDPYAALGVMIAFDIEPAVIAGRATATTAGASLTARLTGRPALNALDPDEMAEMDRLLEVCLAAGSPAGPVVGP